jgi:hypothetical protein
MPIESGLKATLERRRGVRVAVVFLTMLTLSLLPLRASCHPGLSGAAQAAGEHQVWHGESQSDPCCASVNDSALVNSAVPDLSGGASAVPFVALLLSGLILPGLAGQPPRPAGAPPPPRSYYARSSRILR